MTSYFGGAFLLDLADLGIIFSVLLVGYLYSTQFYVTTPQNAKTLLTPVSKRRIETLAFLRSIKKLYSTSVRIQDFISDMKVVQY